MIERKIRYIDIISSSINLLRSTKKILCLIFVLILLDFNVTYSAPAMWRLALNHETKQCAGYWSGDEYTRYVLPEGWKAYYPKFDPSKKRYIVETEIGSCQCTTFHNKDIQECCSRLGYAYVSENIGLGTTTTFRHFPDYDKNEDKESHKENRDYSGKQLARRLADSVAVLIRQANAQDFVSLVSREGRTNEALEYFNNSLRKFESLHGKIKGCEFKKVVEAAVGTTSIEGKRVPSVLYNFLYEILTERKLKSEILLAAMYVSSVDNQPTLLTFSLESFNGVKAIPLPLRDFAQDLIREANLQLQDKNEETPHLAKERQRVLERFDGYDWSWRCWQDERKLTLWKENITELEKRGKYWLVIGYSSDRGKKEASTDEAGRILIIYDIENDKVTDLTHGGDLDDIEIDNDGKIIKGRGPEYC